MAAVLFFSLTWDPFTYSSVRKLVKLSAVQFMLNNHTVSTRLGPPMMQLGPRQPPSGRFLQSEHFSFLGVNNQSNLSDMRCRTTFYTALGRLLMVDLGKLRLAARCPGAP